MGKEPGLRGLTIVDLPISRGRMFHKLGAMAEKATTKPLNCTLASNAAHKAVLFYGPKKLEQFTTRVSDSAPAKASECSSNATPVEYIVIILIAGHEVIRDSKQNFVPGQLVHNPIMGFSGWNHYSRISNVRGSATHPRPTMEGTQ